MTQAEMNSSLIKMDQLRTLIDQHFPKAKIDYEDVCYINNKGEYFIPHYVTDHKDIDCLFFEYANNESDAEKGLFYDGEWIYIPDYSDGHELFEEAVKQINA